MTELVIKSGDSGNTAEVDTEKRLRTFAISQKDSVDASDQGDTFFITSGIINLTSANISHIIYIKNNDTVNWVVEQITTNVGPSVGAPGLDLATNFTINPTGGTLITAGTPSAAANMNIGSPTPLEATIFTGAEGSTITGGVTVPPGLLVSDQRSQLFNAGPIIIAPGTSASIGVTPGVGNTAMKASFTIIVYRKTSAR